MLFTEVLSKNGLTEETVSHSLKVKIRRYNKLNEAVEEAKLKLPGATSAKARVNLETEIKLGEENLVAMNEDISTGVQKYFDNIEVNKKKAENLVKTRAAKGNGKTEPAASTEKKEEKPTSVQLTIDEEKLKKEKAEEEEKKKKKTTAKTEEKVEEGNEVVVEEKKKKSNAAAWVGGILLAGALALVGVKVYQSNKE